jgi:hypothetical protein
MGEVMRDLLRFPPESRVWVYPSSRPFSDEEKHEIEVLLDAFAVKWTSHNVLLEATAGIMHDRFLVLVVDETKSGASGCSIDASVHYLQALGERYDTDFFERTRLYYLDKGSDVVRDIQLSDVKSAFEEGVINEDTLFFDNLVSTKGAFQEGWLKPLSGSWMHRFVK